MSLEEAQEYLMQLLQDANIPNDQNTVMLVLASLALAFDIDFKSNEDLIPLAEACQQQEQDPNVGRDTLVSSISLLATGETPMGRFGLKIYNLMRLRGVCPPGSLVSYYKVGGKVCKKCVKKSTKGSKVSKDSDGTIEDYKAEYDKRAREYAQQYSHLQSKSVGGAIDAQPKYSGKGPNGISKHRGGGRLILRFEEGGTPNRSILDIIRSAVGQAGDYIKNIIKSIVIGPRGEAVPVDNVGGDINNLPEGYRPMRPVEAKEILHQYADDIAPFYDRASGASIGPASAERIITRYQYEPVDTTIVVNPYGEENDPHVFTNQNIDLDRRAFDYYNLSFPNKTTRVRRRVTPPDPVRVVIVGDSTQSLKHDTSIAR